MNVRNIVNTPGGWVGREKIKEQTGFKMWHLQEQDGYQPCQSRAYVLSNRKA